MADKLLSVNELADALGVSRRTVYRLVDTGEIPGYRVANVWRFDLGEVKAALRQPGQDRSSGQKPQTESH
jgi:excisionase family DNA binding protein